MATPTREEMDKFLRKNYPTGFPTSDPWIPIIQYADKLSGSVEVGIRRGNHTFFMPAMQLDELVELRDAINAWLQNP